MDRVKSYRYWLLLADRARARIVGATRLDQAYDELDHLVHPESQLRGREVDTDGPGRSFDVGGPGRHAMERERDVRDQEADQFAGELSEYLHQAAVDNRFERLIVAASPPLLGRLRKKYSDAVRAKLYDEFGKDLTKVRVQDLPRHFAA